MNAWRLGVELCVRAEILQDPAKKVAGWISLSRGGQSRRSAMKVIGKNNGHVYLYGNVAGAHVALSKTFFSGS